MTGNMIAVLILLFGTSQGFKWMEREMRVEGGGVEVCSGQNIQLLWNFTLDQGEKLKEMVWTCQPDGRDYSDMMMASFMDGHFVPMAAFSGRLAHLQSGGVELSCATVLESGTYTVSVSVETDPDVISVHNNTVSVVVLDMPKSPEDEVRMTVDSQAVLDDTEGSWHVRLQCGNVSDRGHPAVDVTWTTPSGKELPSSGYEDGFFQLLLPNPPEGGTYNCTIDRASQPAAKCLDPHSPLLDSASAFVDETSARFTLLEARQQELSDMMKEQQSQWLNSDLSNRTSRLETWIAAVPEDALKEAVSFHASLENDLDLSNAYSRGYPALVFDDVTHNRAQGYDPDNGRFTAPTSGNYFFAVTACTLSKSHSGSIYIKTSLAGRVAELEIDPSSHYSGSVRLMGTAQVVVGLVAGERVWVEAYYTAKLRNGATSFSGFRI